MYRMQIRRPSPQREPTGVVGKQKRKPRSRYERAGANVVGAYVIQAGLATRWFYFGRRVAGAAKGLISPKRSLAGYRFDPDAFRQFSVYNKTVAESLKVPEDEFKAVIRALLNTPPMPASAIEGKRPRKADAQKPGPKKRG